MAVGNAEYYKIACYTNNKAPHVGETTKRGVRKTTNTPAFGVITGAVNGITVVDLDSYKWKTEADPAAANHPWIVKFGANYIQKFNTYSVRTVSGGVHLYFQYEPELKNCVGDKCQIDIRNDHGYVIGAGSYIDMVKSGKRVKGKYNVCRNATVAKMPEELKLWLFENTPSRVKAPEDDPITNDLSFDIPARDLHEIITVIYEKNKDYIEQNGSWRDITAFTSHIKSAAAEGVWDAFSKLAPTKYDKAKNDRILRKCREVPNYAIKPILRLAGMSERLPYYQYKEWNETKYSWGIAELTGNRRICEPIPRRIDRAQLGDNFYDEFLNNKSLIVKSDMGTGKSHSFLRFINNGHHKYISITPRQLLAYAQYESAMTAIEDADDCPQLYDFGQLDRERSVIIQMDSIMRLADWDFSEFVLFLDEVSSSIDYLINANTPSMSKMRCIIVELFIRMIRECACVIAVDADVDYATHALFQRLGVDYDYVLNTHKHSEDVPAFEFANMAEYYDHVASKPAWLVPCDSKIQAKAISAEMDKRGVKHILITSEWRGRFDLMEHACVIYSPKVIMGCDSVWVGGRGVYPCYVGKTINPMHYMQQCNRERNMTELGYIFVNKFATYYKDKSTNEWKLCRGAITNIPRYEDPACVRAYCEFINNYELIIIAEHNSPEVRAIYSEMFAFYTYRDDSLNSNKFYHFRRILQERGFAVVYRDYKQSKNEVAKRADVLKIDDANFTPNKLDAHHIEIRDFLGLPDHKIEEYREYFIDDMKLAKHKNISYMFIWDIAKLREATVSACEFKERIIKDNFAQILLINDLITDCFGGSYSRETGKITLNTPTDKAPQYMQGIKNAFNLKLAATTFKTPTDGYNMLKLLSRRMFGKDLMYSDRVRVAGTDERRRDYYFCVADIEKEKRLYMWRGDVEFVKTGYDDE